MLYDYFVSYHRSDREMIANATRRLEQRGLKVWYDGELEGGDDWREKIVEALTHSEMLVIFFSEECNNSRQIKKELAIADSLKKPVIPILIEDTKPRGAYLYELADRNWLQAFPDPMAKLGELVEHLAMLANKPDAAPAAALQASPAEEIAPEAEAASHASASMDAAPAAEAVAAAPRASDAYVGKVSERNKKKPVPTNDILPFRWIDLVFLGPMLGILTWGMIMEPEFQVENEPLYLPLGFLVLGIGLVGFYGAMVFPFRYYLRKRPFWTAVWSYGLSTLIIIIAFLGAFMVGYTAGIFPHDDPRDWAIAGIGMWIGYAVLAFLIYGLLNAQRAVRTFHRNIKKL